MIAIPVNSCTINISFARNGWLICRGFGLRGAECGAKIQEGEALVRYTFSYLNKWIIMYFYCLIKITNAIKRIQSYDTQINNISSIIVTSKVQFLLHLITYIALYGHDAVCVLEHHFSLVILLCLREFARHHLAKTISYSLNLSRFFHRVFSHPCTLHTLCAAFVSIVALYIVPNTS